VAIEQVKGTFVLQHYGMLHRGEERLLLEVVPDSGTGQLQNLAGKMEIQIDGEKHYYEFDFTLD
jgi:hypothetical protein